jgi:hypothetical protein
VITEGSQAVALDPDPDVAAPDGACEALFDPLGVVLGDPDPGRTMIRMTTTITTTTSSSRSRRRRQYTDGGCGPTGFLIVDMPPG